MIETLVYKTGNDTRAVRVVMIDGDPWFVLADICTAIGLSNPTVVASRLDTDEKGLSSTDTLGGKQELTVVSEAGLYSVVIGARPSEKTKAFKRWVTHDVLPTLRKTGTYTIPTAAAPTFPTDPLTLALEAALETRRQVQAIQADVDRLKQIAADAKIDSAQTHRVYVMGQALGKKMGYSKAWRMFKDRFGLAAYRDLEQSRFDEALDFLTKQIEAWRGQLPLLNEVR